jgi:hypothetical protein
MSKTTKTADEEIKHYKEKTIRQVNSKHTSLEVN